ncbi:hypothetical protein TorRG33x02_163110, partial [Trema orientale]
SLAFVSLSFLFTNISSLALKVTLRIEPLNPLSYDEHINKRTQNTKSNARQLLLGSDLNNSFLHPRHGLISPIQFTVECFKYNFNSIKGASNKREPIFMFRFLTEIK